MSDQQETKVDETKGESFLVVAVNSSMVAAKYGKKKRWLYHEGDLVEEQTLQSWIHEEDQECANDHYASLFVAVHQVTLLHARGLAGDIAELIMPFLAPACGCYSEFWFFEMSAHNRDEETLLHQMAIYRYRGPNNKYPRFNEILARSLRSMQHTHVYPPIEDAVYGRLKRTRRWKL